MTAAEVTVHHDGVYVNGRWVIDVDYERIDVPNEAEAIFYSVLWGTPYHNEGDRTEDLWWVELPEDLKRRVALLRQAPPSTDRLVFKLGWRAALRAIR